MTASINEYTLDEVKRAIETAYETTSSKEQGTRASFRTCAEAQDQGYDPEFYGGWELTDAAEAMIHGWDAHADETAAQMEELLSEMQEKVNDYLATSSREVLDVSGGFVDIDRYLHGEPECMVEQWMDEGSARGKAVKVLVNCVASSGVRAEDLLKRGVAVVAAVNAVIASGMNVEVWVGESVSRGGRDRYGYSPAEHSVELVCLKEFNDYIDPNVMSFCIGHPAMLRRIIFFLNEQRDEDERRTFGFHHNPEWGYGGYGSVCEFPDEVQEQFDLVIGKYQPGQDEDPATIYDSLITRSEQRASEYA